MPQHKILAAAAGLALALGGTALMAPAAHAAPETAAAAGPATLVHEDGAVWYKAAAGQTNELTISVENVDADPSEFGSDYRVTFRDRVEMSIDASASEWDSCLFPSADDRTVVQCTVPAPLGSDDSTIYEADLGDGDDTVTVTSDNSAIAAVHGGPDNDVLQGVGQIQYNGDGGDDRIDGSNGLGSDGGDGDDVLVGACQYTCRGGAGNDSVTGTGDINALYGDDGDDILRAGSDNDLVYGGRGHDTLYGEGGNDTMYGNSGNDVLYGGTGSDTLSGGPGTNEVHQD
ncbi:calcium-binding protein [Streptomyces lycii]|uniref:Calcium-binding protein n=1 Tax=Streptomyces lycii TaxID=2654337 RepID=A0ABQ7FKC5_9ACTN|nr:calcium-binding protein [Streptomyces lycii]KAF4408064.1 calcium-binding protein [Streptomyces lycii]